MELLRGLWVVKTQSFQGLRAEKVQGLGCQARHWVCSVVFEALKMFQDFNLGVWFKEFSGFGVCDFRVSDVWWCS